MADENIPKPDTDEAREMIAKMRRSFGNFIQREKATSPEKSVSDPNGVMSSLARFGEYPPRGVQGQAPEPSPPVRPLPLEVLRQKFGD